MTAAGMHADQPAPSHTHREADAAEAGWVARLFSPRGEVVSASVAGLLLLIGWVFTGLDAPGAAVFYWASLALGMVHGGRAAIESARERHFDIDMLMAVAALMAAVIGQPAEGALLLFLFVLAGGLEGLAMARTRRAIEALHQLIPTATLRQDPSGEWVPTEPESLVPGDRIKLLPGELVPTDAQVEVGDTAINQASLTGESMPRIVHPGDEIYAGTINVGNPIEAKVTRPASESSLRRIMNLVLEAQQQREPVQRLIDRYSEPYAIGVMAVSIAVFLIWWLILGEPIFVTEGENAGRGALYTAITLLVVMSPCAVIIATPTATLCGIARGARAGVLFKGGQSIERLARVRAIAMDKTGTLTIGRPRVQQVHPIGWSDASELLAVAAGLEEDSTHPIAAAIREAAELRGVTPMKATRATFTPGRGVSGVFDGAPARLGTIEHAEELIPVCLRARTRELLWRVQERGQIATVIAWDGQAGVIIMHDEPRPGASTLVADLARVGVAPVVMLTGDNRATAEATAARLGITRWKAELLPQDKVAAIEELRRELAADAPGGIRKSRAAGVGVIGDGVNDAPALAAADVSIAIGSIGSDAALESADIVLLGDDLSTIPWAIGLARRTRRIITLNLIFALSAITIMALATLIGSRTGHDLPLWVGVLGHEGGTLLVVANSLTLLGAAGPARSRRRSEPDTIVRQDSPTREPAIAAR